MKIAHVLDHPFDHFGGIHVLARELAYGLSDEFETVILCPTSLQNPDLPLSLPETIKLDTWDPGCGWNEIIHFLKDRMIRHDVCLAFFHGGDFSWGPNANRLSVLNHLANRSYRQVYVNHQTTPFLPIVNLEELRNPLIRWIRLPKLLVRWALKYLQLSATDLEINVSSAEHHQSIRRYFLCRGKFLRIYHSRISAGSIRDLTGGKDKIILNVGHFAFRKGQHVLLDAFGRIAARHPDWKLQMVGAHAPGDYLTYLHEIIDRHHIHGQVELVQETTDPDRYFKHASIYVQPSIVEAYGIALQEAMCFRCACVGAATGGIPDSISNPDLLFDSGDSEGLSRILEKLMSDQRLKHETAENAFIDAQKFGRTREAMLSSYRKMIHDLIHNRKWMDIP